MKITSLSFDLFSFPKRRLVKTNENIHRNSTVHPPVYDDQEFDSVMAFTLGTSNFGDRAKKYSVDYFRKVGKQKQTANTIEKHIDILQCWSRRLARAQFGTNHRLLIL